VPDSTPTTVLPPPLALLRDTPAGAIYALAAKNELLEGVDRCRQGAIGGAEWSDYRRVLTLRLQSGRRITFAADGPRLRIECSCGKGSPGRHCSHVVTGWALLKRVVSPESFASFRLSDQLVRDVEILVGLRDGDVSAVPKRPSLAEQLVEARRIRAAKLKERSAAQPGNSGTSATNASSSLLQ
jgi:hypothetical protein